MPGGLGYRLPGMTIANSIRSAGPFSGTGSTVAYPFSFKIFETSDLLVSRADESGVQTELILGTHYTVTKNADQNESPGGVVTLLTPLPVGYTLFITTDLAILQPLRLTNTGGFYPEAIEDALDRIVMLIQQQGYTGLGQAIRVPEVTGIPVLPVAASRAGLLLGFAEDGSVALVAPISGSAADLAIRLASTATGLGASLVGFIQPETGALPRTAMDKLRTLVSRADYLTDGNYDAARAAKTGRSDLVVRPTGKTDTLLSAALVAFENDAKSTAVDKGASLIGTTFEDAPNVQAALDKLDDSGLFDIPPLLPYDVPAVVLGVAGTTTLDVPPQVADRTLPAARRAVVFIKVAEDRLLIRVPVVGGGPQDWVEYMMFDWSSWMYDATSISPKPAITHAWAFHSMRAVIGGRESTFLTQPLDKGLVSTTEFAMEIGVLADDYLPEGNPVPTYKRVGYGHGGLSDTTPSASLTITVNGIAGNLASAAVGTVFEGCNAVISQTHRVHLLAGSRENEAIGTVTITHLFDARGMTILHDHTVTASGIGVGNTYSAMMPMTGCDRIKAKGGAIAQLNLKDGSQVGNWAGTDRYAAWDSQNAVALMELTLPTLNPGTPPGDWSYATTSQSFAVNNTNGLSKFYVNWRSGAAPIAMPASHSHQFRIAARRGAPG